MIHIMVAGAYLIDDLAQNQIRVMVIRGHLTFALCVTKHRQRDRHRESNQPMQYSLCS